MGTRPLERIQPSPFPKDSPAQKGEQGDKPVNSESTQSGEGPRTGLPAFLLQLFLPPFT